MLRSVELAVLAVMLAARGGVVALALANRLGPAEQAPPSGDTAALSGETLAQEAEKTNGRFGRALAAHRSLDGRLRGVADSAIEHAAVLQQLHDHELAPRGVRANADWRPPPELSPDLPRPGPSEDWQTLDRSFHALLALDDEQASFAQNARAYQTVGDASRALADALSTAPVEQLAAGCSFCAKPRQSLRKLIAGPGIYICDECVDLCVEILEEQLGDDWRPRPDADSE